MRALQDSSTVLKSDASAYSNQCGTSRLEDFVIPCSHKLQPDIDTPPFLSNWDVCEVLISVPSGDLLQRFALRISSFCGYIIP